MHRAIKYGSYNHIDCILRQRYKCWLFVCLQNNLLIWGFRHLCVNGEKMQVLSSKQFLLVTQFIPPGIQRCTMDKPTLRSMSKSSAHWLQQTLNSQLYSPWILCSMPWIIGHVHPLFSVCSIKSEVFSVHALNVVFESSAVMLSKT